MGDATIIESTMPDQVRGPVPARREPWHMINSARMAKILVVDDNAELLNLLQLAMDRAGHAVYAACDGQQALALADRLEFDLVITDLIMPVVEGVEMIMRLQKRHPRTRIIAMSGGGTRVPARNYLGIAQSLGVVRTLVKPFSNDELLESVNHELAIRREIRVGDQPEMLSGTA